MKNKSSSTIYIIITTVFTILYLLLAAKPLNKEYHFLPQWLISTANPTTKENTENKELIFFNLQNSLGYFTEDGDITLYKTYPDKASISEEFFSLYSTKNSPTKIFNNLGKEVGTFDVQGFPYFIKNQIYIFLPGGASFSKCNSEGKVLWTYEGVMPITAFNGEENFTSVGFLDGTIKIFNNETGKLINSYKPGGSDYQTILGIDVSADGKYIASISGHDKQRFIITEVDSTHPKIIFHKYLQNDTTSRSLVHFCNNQKKVIYVCENSINIYDLKKDKNYVINVDKKIIQIEENENQIFLLGKENNEYSVYLIEKTNILEGNFSFQADDAFIRTQDNSLYIGKNNTISKLTITRE